MNIVMDYYQCDINYVYMISQCVGSLKEAEGSCQVVDNCNTSPRRTFKIEI